MWKRDKSLLVCTARRPIPVNFRELGIEVATTLRAFPQTGLPRLAAVNSFGFGGTNACALIQQGTAASGNARSALLTTARRCYCRFPQRRLPRWPLLQAHLRIRSKGAARSQMWPARLRFAVRISAIAPSLARNPPSTPSQACERSRAATCLRKSSADAAEGRSGWHSCSPARGRNGAAWAGHSKAQYALPRGCRDLRSYLRAALGWSLVDELALEQERIRMDQTFVAQPILFALQVGLAALWKDWGIQPAAVIGHSVGEIAAAYICGALSLNDALAVVYHRSRLQERARMQGAMAAIAIAAQEARHRSKNTDWTWRSPRSTRQSS